MPAWQHFLILGLLLAPTGEPTIEELRVAVDGGQVLVGFHLANGLDSDTRERIASGLPTSFIYELELKRDRKHWWDRGLNATILEVVAMYNAVTREYLVNTKQGGKLIESRTVRDEEELELAMTVFENFPAFTLEADPDNSRFLVRVRVDLGPGAALGFIPYQRSTGWLESNKVRLRAPEP
ncbi:MAG: DUF4390 domain-containing protein [Thermoanaerobaculia bacterium]